MPTAGTSAGTPAPCKVIVVGEDQRTADAVRMGFERDGFPVVTTAELAPEAVDEHVGLIVASATDASSAVSALGQAIRARGDGGRDIPVLYVGNGVSRREATSAGADEVIGRPAFVRDVVTIGRMLAGQPPENRGHWVGQLAETVSVYYLVRALSSLGRSGVLTMSRGLRRGEVRFYLGEVTSAQVGGLHGQAALHQLLLWTDGRFDFRREDVVRRRQIPLLPEELFADAERFLVSVREVSGGLSPAMVFEQDIRQMQNQGRNVPTEVHGVLRMFDGNRTLADVIEDSPYRVFETMRVASTAVQAGLLRRVAVERPKTKFRAVLALEEWLAGESKAVVVDRVASLTDSGTSNPVAAPPPPAAGKRRKKGGRGGSGPVATPPAVKPTVPTAVDWGALVPRGVAVEMQGLSQVVPTQQTSGEITIPKDLGEAPATRKSTRERLESLTADLRDRMFPTDGPPPPNIEVQVQLPQVPEPVIEPVIEPVPEAPAEPPPVAMEAPPMVASIAEPTSGPSIDAVPRTIASTGMTPLSMTIPTPEEIEIPPAGAAGNTLQFAVVPMPSAGDTMRSPAISADDTTPLPKIEPLPPPPVEERSGPVAQPAILTAPLADATSREQREAAEAAEWSQREREARARAEAAERAEAEEWERRELAAKERAAVEAAEVDARARAQAEAAAAERARAEADAAVAAAERARAEAERARAEADERARAAAAHLEIAERMRQEMAARLRAEAERAEAEEAATAEAERRLAAERGRLEAERDAHERAEVDKALVRAKEIAERMRTEAAASSKALADVERVRAMAEQLNAETDAADRARVAADAARDAGGSGAEAARTMHDAEAERRRQAEAHARIGAEAEARRQAEAAAAAQAEARAMTDAVAARSAAEAETAAKAKAEADERVVAAARAKIEADDKARAVRSKTPSGHGSQKRRKSASTPGVTSGELGGRKRKPTQPPAEGPTMLVDDLAAAQAAVANVAGPQAARGATADAKSVQAEAGVSGVRRDAKTQAATAATHFDELEEEFFEQGASPSYGHPSEPTESFDDLDQGYQPTGFWDRLLGRDKKPPRRR